MNSEKMIEVWLNCIHERKLVLKKKNYDYANKDNAFSNFEEVARIAGIKVEKVFLSLIAVKVARLSELLNSDKEPQNESILDTLMDLSNYSDLFYVYLKEKK
ncbi:MAG TPA: hypothetical protein PLJ44_09585 [Victivallales bacterium]|nr:hypothetical protein [Victivallales bacterium]